MSAGENNQLLVSYFSHLPPHPSHPPPNIWALLCDCNAYRYANAFSLRGVVGWLCARGLLLPSAVLVNLGSWILGGGEVDVLPSYCS